MGLQPIYHRENQYLGAYLAVVESVSKLIATGGNTENCYLTFQEYFERMTSDSKRWGQPTAALLGALTAQLELGIASIGGKDSMSGTFEDIDVPPTLVSFAVSVGSSDDVMSPEWKLPCSKVYYIEPKKIPTAHLTQRALKRYLQELKSSLRRKRLSPYLPRLTEALPRAL